MGNSNPAQNRSRPMTMLISEALDEAVYEPRSETLFLRFSDGDWYAYLQVAPSLYADLLAAPSKGRFFQDHIRDRYAFRRLDR
jgi:hypothetical protein